MKTEETVIDEIKNEGGLCPLCEKNILKVGGLNKITSLEDDGVIFYILCLKCHEDIRTSSPDRERTITRRINKRLDKKFVLYSAKIYKDKDLNSLSRDNSDNYLQELPIDNEWNDCDRTFFSKNPNRKFMARRVFPNELEETYKNSTKLKENAEKNNISYAIIHELAPGQRVRTYLGGLNGYPYNEEEFVAALFLILLSDEFSLKDLDKLHNEIKERKININKLGIDFTKINK